METVIMHPQNKEQLSALKAIAKALNVDFETTKESPYNPEFVKKIKASRKQVEDGEFVKFDPTKSLWENLQ
jgi:hypothetical protein